MGLLEDRTAVITGGGTGVGAAVALALAEAGADVYLIGRRLNKLELVAAKAREFGVNAAVQSVDISTSSGQLQAIQRIKADLSASRHSRSECRDVRGRADRACRPFRL